MASFGLPGLAGFWGEAFSVLAAWQHGGIWWRIYAVVAAVGAAAVVAYFLRALYCLGLPPSTPSGGFSENALKTANSPAFSGKTSGVLLAVVPLVVVTLLLGVWPGGVLALATDAVNAITGSVT